MLDLLHSIYVRIHRDCHTYFPPLPVLSVAAYVRALVLESAAGVQKTQNMHEKQ